MGELNTDVLYVAELFHDHRLLPIRVLDTRHWTSVVSADRSGFEWWLGPGDRDDNPWDTDHGMACLYWAGDPDPDGQALLDYPWEPLPENPDEAADELTRRTKSMSRGHSSEWLCLRPVQRSRITARWVEPGRRAAWEQASARLTALGLGSVQYGGPGDTAPMALNQLTALLDLAEQAGTQ